MEVPSQDPPGQVQSPATTGSPHLPLGMEVELGHKLHKAINQKDLDKVRGLLDTHRAPLEERDDQGLTPLYNAVCAHWPDGALLLLEAGADIRNAESIPENLHYSHPPLMHLAIKTGSQPLVRELVKRGASLTVTDFTGHTCVSDHGFSSLTDLFDCLASSLTQEGRSPRDFLHDACFVIGLAVQTTMTPTRVREFIKRQPRSYWSKMFEAYAACLCIVYSPWLALPYWRMSARCLLSQTVDDTVEEEKTPTSVLADILNVEEHPLPDSVSTEDDKVAVCIQAFLVVEKLMRDHSLMLSAGKKLAFLLQSSRPVTALGVLKRAATATPLYQWEVPQVVDRLVDMLEFLRAKDQLPFSAVVDLLKVVQDCLSCLNAPPRFEARDSSSFLGMMPVNFYFQILFECVFDAMEWCYSKKVLTTPDQLQELTSHVTDIIRLYSSFCCAHPFRNLAETLRFRDSSMTNVIKDLVVLSSDVSGTVRQMNNPIHLVANEDGDTPCTPLQDTWTRRTCWTKESCSVSSNTALNWAPGTTSWRQCEAFW